MIKQCKSVTPKTHDCQECVHRNYKGLNIVCQFGHKPRFFMPKHPLDTGWGWKRRCVDFAQCQDITPKWASEKY